MKQLNIYCVLHIVNLGELLRTDKPNIFNSIARIETYLTESFDGTQTDWQPPKFINLAGIYMALESYRIQPDTGQIKCYYRYEEEAV